MQKVNIKIDVNVTAPELTEAINRLADVWPNSANVNVGKREPSKVKETEPKVEEKPKKPAKSKKEPKEPTVTDEPAQNTDPETKTITLEDVRAKLATLSQDGKQADVKALITEFGAQKLSDIPVEKYPELLKKSEAL